MDPANRRNQPNSGNLIDRAGTLARIAFRGLRALFRKENASNELDEELRGYLQAAAEDKMRRSPGMTPAEALRAARLEMGSMEAVKEEVRSSGWESAPDALWQDIRYGIRQLLQSPGFTAIAVLTLALGIGANTAIFTLVHAVLLKELPISDPGSLYRVGQGELYCCEWGGLQDSWGTFDYPFYKHLRDTDPSFKQLAAFSGGTPTFSVRREGSPEAAHPINGEFVSGNYFATLGLKASAGRLLGPEDDLPGASPAVVIGYRAWQRQFGGDPSIVGSSMVIKDRPFMVAGVAPRGFVGARFASDPPELWIPINQTPAFESPGQESLLGSSGMAWLYVVGRLAPGPVAPARVASQLTAELREWLRSEGRRDDAQHTIAKQRIQLTSGATGVSPFRSNATRGLQLLTAASALLLLIACANIANLLLVRSNSRKQQIALRLSLGATRPRLIRAALTESVLLSLIGGAAGLLLAYGGTSAILSLAFRGANYIPIEASPSPPVLVFTLLLSILTGVIFGVAPAWIGTHEEPAAVLRGSSRRTTSRSSLSQRTFVVVQTALSVVLLAVAGLVTQSLRNLETANLGFETEGRLLANISFGAAGYQPAQLPGVYDEIQTRLEAIPGVRSASLSLNSPQSLCCVNLNVTIGGRSERWIGDVNVLYERVTPRYFATIGTPLLRGRFITRQDTQASTHVAVVDQSFAAKFFPGEDAIGRHFGLSLPGHENDYEIAGVVRDTKYRNPASAQSPMFFLPYTQTTEFEPAGYRRLETETLYAQSIELSVAGVPENYAHALRAAVAAVNPNLLVISVKSYGEQVAVQYNQERLLARLTGLFSLVALLSASVGLYGVTAYTVARRSGEIGIRMALGASRASVVGMVLQGAFLQVGIGLCIGIPLAILSARYLNSQLYGVGRFDPLVLGTAILVLAACAFLAGFLPARHAASIHPSDALRLD